MALVTGLFVELLKLLWFKRKTVWGLWFDPLVSSNDRAGAEGDLLIMMTHDTTIVDHQPRIPTMIGSRDGVVCRVCAGQAAFHSNGDTISAARHRAFVATPNRYVTGSLDIPGSQMWRIQRA